MATRALIHMSSSARRGDVVEIRTLLQHPMESGYRADSEGRVLPRNIVRSFACRYGGELVFSAELHPAIAANPYLAFSTLATASGTLVFTWSGDNNFSHTETMFITVT